MTREEIFACWAPPASPWSAWARPTLFVEARPLSDELIRERVFSPAPVDWAPAPSERAALVLDVPGPQAIRLGLSLAAAGYRPVPLFNGAASGFRECVRTDDFRDLLALYADDLAALRIRDDAPPVFLLDSRRLAGGRHPAPGSFDNRWVVFLQDFPSATRLSAHGIRRAVWITESPDAVCGDVLHVLRSWARDGLPVTRQVAEQTGEGPLPAGTFSLLRALWYRLGAVAGLSRHNTGGFGAPVPLPEISSGSGYRGFG